MYFREACDGHGQTVERSANRSGFTLVEVMVASMILAFLFAGILYGAIQASNLQFAANSCYAASVIGRNRIEKCKVYSYSALSMMAEIDEQVDFGGESSSSGTFWRTTLVITNPAANSSCTEVTVQVRYESKPNRFAPVPFETSTLIDS